MVVERVGLFVVHGHQSVQHWNYAGAARSGEVVGVMRDTEIPVIDPPTRSRTALWQDSPWRARQWAEERYGSDAAVVVARVELDGCLDLQNPSWQEELRDADFEFAFECVA